MVWAPAEGDKLLFASLGNRPPQFGIIVIGEIEKWRRGAELFPLKEHGHEGRGEHERGGYLCAPLACFMADAFALGTIAYLVVVLHESDKTMPGEAHHLASVVAPAIFRIVAVVNEDAAQRLGQCASEPKSA